MMGTLRPRGPDGRGVHVDASCRFAHARLVIDGEELVVTFHGEIFNHLELREDLEQKRRSTRYLHLKPLLIEPVLEVQA